MAYKRPLDILPVLSPRALDKVHAITESCRRKLRTHENYQSSTINSEKAEEITRTYAVEEFDIRMADYVENYDFNVKMVPRIIGATVSSILSAFPGGSFPDRSAIGLDLKSVLERYVRSRSDIRLPPSKVSRHVPTAHQIAEYGRAGVDLSSASPLLTMAVAQASLPVVVERGKLRDEYRKMFPQSGIMDICWAARQHYREWARWLKGQLKDGSKPDRAFRSVLGSAKEATELRTGRPKGWK